jgi:hypothetical protein
LLPALHLSSHRHFHRLRHLPNQPSTASISSGRATLCMSSKISTLSPPAG